MLKWFVNFGFEGPIILSKSGKFRRKLYGNITEARQIEKNYSSKGKTTISNDRISLPWQELAKE